ncbi:MAG: Lrp/AsnC family transcriptional regulator [Flavobacteriales bacterium]|jgi:Lrp/AsnC family transcriptional regulator, leucine-responsive regulatory protein|nr:Lrp/AsnC family transcriptional regulator [Flavobacteriales bacterium]
MDAHDTTIIGLLTADGRAAMQTISAETGLSRSAVFNRIRRLEKSGVIRGYTARIDRAAMGLQIHAFCNVSLKEHSATFLEEFEAGIGAFKEVVACFHIAGSMDYLIEIQVADMEGFHRFISQRLAAMNNIGTVQSSFVMREVCHS